MWYSIQRVATDHYLDEHTAFEVAEDSRFVSLICGEYHTNSLMINAFITEVKMAQGEKSMAIRKNLIARQMKNFASAI